MSFYVFGAWKIIFYLSFVSDLKKFVAEFLIKFKTFSQRHKSMHELTSKYKDKTFDRPLPIHNSIMRVICVGWYDGMTILDHAKASTTVE